MRPAHTEDIASESRLSAAARFLFGIGPLIGLIALCVAGTLLNGDFATFDNAMNVLTRTSFIGIIAVGMTFVIISGGIDLSVGSMAALIAGSMIYLMNGLMQGFHGHAVPPLLIIVLALALALGELFGFAHGLLVTKGRIEPFIVTLGTLGIFRALLTWLADGGALVLKRTVFGRHAQAIGSNEQVARYAAIRVDRVKIATYMLLGLCVAVATVLYVPRLGSATPTTGLLWELEAIAGRRRYGAQGRRRARDWHRDRRDPAVGHQQHPESDEHHQRVSECGWCRAP